ncbi:MAG: 3-dehydroquinate dehydratase [Ignavibacteriaceae bacterium]|nr:3-dehydroquinate dehydratase [Ignavibacteriaceae bacterium]
MKILVLNGPNLNLLTSRGKDNYGALSIESIEKDLRSEFPDIHFEFYQSNHEGELVDKIQKADDIFDGIIINSGGYSHTSVAIHDALEISKLIKIEVHLSHLVKREEFRQQFITARACNGFISGFKNLSYNAAVYLILKFNKTVI